MRQPRFSNARSVRNAVERCRLRQAKRLVELKRPLSKADLVTLTAEDVYGSSIFALDDAGDTADTADTADVADAGTQADAAPAGNESA